MPEPRRRSAGASSTPASPSPASSVEERIMNQIDGGASQNNDAALLNRIFSNVQETNLSDSQMNDIVSEAIHLDDVGVRRKGFMVEYHGIQKTGKTFDSMAAAALVPENPNLSSEMRLLLEKGIIPSGSPVFLIDTEMKAQKLQHLFKNTGKNIFIFPIFYQDPSRPMQIDPKKCLMKMAQILKTLNEKFPDRGTIVIDSVTDVTDWVRKYLQYELVGRSAEGYELGELIRMQPSDWQVRDDIWNYILKTLQMMPHHIILTSREKEDWDFSKDEDGKSSGKTSRLTPRRYRDIPFQMDIEIGLRYKYDEMGNIVSRVGKIISNQYDDESLIGKEITNPTFIKIAEMLIPISHKLEIAKLKGETQHASQS